MLEHCKRIRVLFGATTAVALVWAGLTLAKPPAPAPPLPPVGGRIAVNDNGYIVMLNNDGTGRTVVAATLSAGNKFALHLEEPAWSPMFSDGTAKIGYDQYVYVPASGMWMSCLMVVNGYPYDGNDPRPVEGLQLSHGLWESHWSPLVQDGVPDKVRLAFVTLLDMGKPQQRSGIYIVDLIYHPETIDPDTVERTPWRLTVADTSKDQDGNLTPVVLDPDPNVEPGAKTSAYYTSARFSPDGQWLALARQICLPDGTFDYSVLVTSSTDPTQQWALIDHQQGRLDWSPNYGCDGEGNPVYQLVFVNGEVYTISFSMTPTGPKDKSESQVTNSCKVAEENPAWSADGSQIAYSYSGGSRSKSSPLGVVIVATGQQYTIGDGAWPHWSPIGVPRLP